MSFLEDFDRRADADAKGETPGGRPAGENPEHRELLDFADLIRSRRAVPDEAECRRIQDRVRSAGAGRRRNWVRSRLVPVAAAAGLLIAAGLLVFFGPGRKPAGPGPVEPQPVVVVEHTPGTETARVSTRRPSRIVDEFAGIDFPTLEARSADGTGRAELPTGAGRARVLRSGGLAMVQRKGESRWRLLSRGDELLPGDTVRTSRRLESGALLLGPEGSRVTAAWGAELVFDGPRAWRLSAGRVHFKVAKRADLPAFTVTTPDGAARALGTEFLLSVEPAAADGKAATLCRVGEGRVELSAAGHGKLELGAGASGRLSRGTVRSADWSGGDGWLRELDRSFGEDHGVGELLASAVGSDTPPGPLEIKSHRVTVTVVDQVARTFIDEEFANNTWSRMEGTFYYPLPPDAAVSEFAMYVNGVRVEGEVLKQHRARQIFEYIVRQQRDPALLEFAGGNLFKMRVFPIEPHSVKRVQLGYTQILPRRDGRVTYSYPLVSEKLLKNPLKELSIDFRVMSSFGLEKLESPTHAVASAMSADGLRGALAFRARDYSPTRDFAVSYRVPRAPECAVFGNRPDGADENFLMLQLCPRADLPSRPAPSRLLVIVDGSASAGAQDYAVASELAASAADIACGWQFAVLRGGHRPELFGGGFLPADGSLSSAVRDWLAERPPLGATDLAATFCAAAAAIPPGEEVQLLYVGDGLDTLGELEGPALVNAILMLFDGRGAEISCAAVGSSYDRAVLAGLASATGGFFTRVEGAADVHAAAGQIADSFYLPVLRDVRVEIDGLDVADVYPDSAATLAQGDTLVILGRPGRAGRGSVRLTGDAGGSRFERRYDVTLEADAGRNRFLPRLWAKAHIDHLLSGMGLSGAEEDARLRGKIIDTSVFYQIMSPFTAFLVLESEQDYGKFGIKRKAKIWDWHGEAGEIGSTTLDAADHEGSDRDFFKRLDAVEEPPAPSMPAPLRGPAFPMVEQSEAIRDWVDIETVEWDGRERKEPLGKDFYWSADDDHFESGEKGELAFKKRDARWAEEEFSDITLGGKLFTEEGRKISRWGGRRGQWGWRYGYAQYVSPILSAGAVVGLKIDQPLQSSAVYRRMAATGDQSLTLMLNLALALEQESRLTEAIEMIEGVIAKLPELPDLWLELGALRHRSGDAEGARKAFAKALELVPEKDREAIQGRITGFYSNVNDYGSAAEAFETLASAAAGEPEKALGHWTQAANWWRNAGDDARALAASGKAVDICRRLATAAADADPQTAANHLATAATCLANVGDADGSRKLWIASAGCHEKLARAAGADELKAAIHLCAAAGWLQNAGETERAGALYARCAEAYAKHARAAAKAEEAIERARSAADAWRNAAQPARAVQVWDEAVTKFPDSAPLKFAAGTWLAGYSIAHDRAAALLAGARDGGQDVDDRLFQVLVRAGRRTDALTELRRLLDAAKDQNEVYRHLTTLYGRSGGAMREEVSRLLGSDSPVLVAGALQTAMNYGLPRDRRILDAFAAALAKPGFPAEARLTTFVALMQYDRRCFDVPGGKIVSVTTVLDPLFENVAKPERLSLAVQAVQHLSGHGFAKEALARAEELLARRDLDDASRAALQSAEAVALQTLGRADEALEKLTALLAQAKDESTAANAAWQLWQHHVGRGDYDKAAEVGAAFARRFPDSATAGAFDHNLLQQLINRGQREEAAKLAARLVKENPGSTVWVRACANFLASDGKFEEAAAALRECLRLNPEPTAAADPRPLDAVTEEDAEAGRRRLVEEAVKAVRRLRERHGLITLLARISAQDAGLRAAFLKEADAAAGAELRDLRSWTEGALLCLAEAAENEELTARLAKLAAAEPDEPAWIERLARAHFSAGEEAKAAAAYKQLLAVWPDRADAMVALAELALRRKDAPAAESWRARALDLLARDPNSLYSQAYSWQNARRYEWALAAWKRLAARGPYARDGSATWLAAVLARQLNFPAEEAALLMQAALAPQGGYIQHATQRLGEMLEDAAAGPAARPVAVELLDELVARAGRSPGLADWQAEHAGDLAQRLGRFEDAAALYTRAMEAPGGGWAASAQNQLRGLLQNPQAQRTVRPMVEKALAGWMRSPEKLCAQAARSAAELAEFLERPDDAIRLAAGVARSSGQPAFDTSLYLVNLAGTSEPRAAAAAAAVRAALSGRPAGEAAIWTGVLDYLLAAKRGDAGTARAALDRLVAARIESPSHAQDVLSALYNAGEKDRLVEYALNGGGDLDANWRRNLLRQAVSCCGGNDERVLRLYRAQGELETGNGEDWRRQLVEALVRFDRLDEAAAELRKTDATSNDYYAREEWLRVINAFWARNTPKDQHRAIELAQAGWERLSGPGTDSYYGQDILVRLLGLCAAADAKNQLDASVRNDVIETLRAGAGKWFASGELTGAAWRGHTDGNVERFVEKHDLRAEIDRMAREAAASDDPGRVQRAANYWQGLGMIGEAKQAWRRVLRLAGGDERNALTQLYSLSAHSAPQQWDPAIEYLERLQKLGVYTGEGYLMERARCLYGLKRVDEAREAVGKLLASESVAAMVRQGNYYQFDSIAQICEQAGDWKTAAEAWEGSIRVWRFLSAQHPGSYWSNLASAYQRAGCAYGEAGDAAKAVDCYLRGLSVVPRDQSSYYGNLVEAILAQLLESQTLDRVVAEYEKEVAAGGGEKPHLRIAFAEAFGRAGNTAEQLRNLRIAADLLPKDMGLRAQVIEGYKQLKDEKAAVAAYLAWAKVDPQNIELWRGLGDYYDSLGRKDEALAAWATMAEVRPREAEGYRAYAAKLTAAGRDEPAAAALRKALRYRPTSFDAASELAAVYRRLKHEKAAAELWVSGEKACRKAMEDFADDPTPWLNLVRFLKAQGRKGEAREVCQKILGRSWPRFQNETHPEANRLLRELQ